MLSKYIPANGFDPFNAGDFEEDRIDFDGNGCLHVDNLASGNVTRLRAPVELPDGSRIDRITFFGEDDDPAENINIRLVREQFTATPQIAPAPPLIERTSTIVDSFSTDGASGAVQVAGTADLDELAGSPVLGSATITTNRFHTVDVDLDNDADADHVLCGVRIDYQVPISSADPGTVFHAIDPIRVYDSRIASFANSGRLDPNTSRVIDITDGYDLDGVAIPAQADAVPSDATAIAYGITVSAQTGPNFTSVTAGDATEFTTSAINFGPTGDVANDSTVTVSGGEIKVWGGDGTGSTHVIIDVLGYYAPAPPPSNMGN